MAINQQRILKSKYLAYRYYCSVYNNNSILAYETIEEDALSKVNILTGEMKELKYLTAVEKDMFNSNLNMIINNLVTTTEPCFNFNHNYKIYSLKNNPNKAPSILVLNKAETIIYTINRFISHLKESKFSGVNGFINSIGTNKILEVTGLSRRDFDDEVAYATSSSKFSNKKGAMFFQALVNCKKIELVVEYLLMNDRHTLFGCIEEDAYDKNDVRFDGVSVKHDDKFYYIFPVSKYNGRSPF